MIFMDFKILIDQLLNVNDAEIRELAAIRLGKISDPKAVECLFKALNDIDKDVRRAAEKALAKICAPDIVRLYLQAFSDEANERSAALKLLRKMGLPFVLAGFVHDSLKGNRYDMEALRKHRYAMEALRKLSDPRAVKELLKVLYDKSSPNECKEKAVEVLGEIGDSKAVEGLLKVLYDKSSSNECKRKAAEALGKIGDPKAVEGLLKALNDGKLNDDDVIRIQCTKCGRNYELPIHAHCVTSFGTIADFGFVWGGEEAKANWIRNAALSDNRNSPDLVSDEGHVPWNEREKFLEEVKCIKHLLSAGQIRWWKCWHCKEVQKYKLIPIPIILVTFQGKTLEEANAVAREIMPKDIDFSIVTSDDVQLKTILKKGETSTIAVKNCYSLIPPNAFDISEVEISKIGQTGTFDLQEDSQLKAYEALSIKMSTSTGRFMDKLSCNVRPRKGFLGFGRRKGTWRVHWFTYFEAKATFKIPATVTVST
ncbi:MAG: hypothetical protein GTO66_14725 [Candidatus Aminicenantes bacterium]|nr:hypothetical protein [Candidatus Aminicenantes bacterium]NIN43185.1 hypothetical protein [Candidatus Aminicenantes bacterium]